MFAPPWLIQGPNDVVRQVKWQLTHNIEALIVFNFPNEKYLLPQLGVMWLFLILIYLSKY